MLLFASLESFDSGEDFFEEVCGFAFFDDACGCGWDVYAHGCAEFFFCGDEDEGDFSFFAEDGEVGDYFWGFDVFGDDYEFCYAAFYGFGCFVCSFSYLSGLVCDL